MIVAELIEKLEQIENKDLRVVDYFTGREINIQVGIQSQRVGEAVLVTRD